MRETGFDATGAVTNERVREEFRRALDEVVADEPFEGYRDTLADAFDLLWNNEVQGVSAIRKKTEETIAKVADVVVGPLGDDAGES